jgi:hypothetical protein
MAKRKAPELSPEAQAANAAKEKQSRLKNAEKQQRFRDSMKAEGYRRVTLWDLPSPADKRLFGAGFRQVPAWELPQENSGKSRAAMIRLAVRIRQSSLRAGARSPEVKKAISRATGEFLKAMGNAPETKALYTDFLELVKLLDDPRGEE